MSDKSDSGVNVSPFPEFSPGPVSGTNGLVRQRFVNGRALTATALRGEQSYLDARARVAAQAFSPGVVWGLGLTLAGRSSPTYADPVGVGQAVNLDGDCVLSAGLAMDAAGRPIAVGSDTVFAFRSLLSAASSSPQEIVEAPTLFQPCVCLRRSTTASAGGASQAGAWLLVIRPEERPEGEAKVYGVQTRAPLGCTPSGWRGGFGLSLARLPVDRAISSASDVWALRGAMAAWYFDTFEAGLAGPSTFGFAPGESVAPEDTAVPLALVLLAPDNGVLFVDPWIPRRAVVEAAAGARSRAGRGGETSARAFARRAQFQVMLAESLKVAPLGAATSPTSLWARGFRHLPPAGILPVPTPQGADALAQTTDALASARAWFAGTNALIGREIATSQGQWQAELEAAALQGPIRLRPTPAASSVGTPIPTDWLQQPALRRFGTTLGQTAVTVEQLTAGDWVLVRLIALLEEHEGGMRARPEVLFVQQPVDVALDLPPPPEALQATEDLRVEITGPEEGAELWEDGEATFSWTVRGGSGVVVPVARLTGKKLSIAQMSGQGGRPDNWSQDLTLAPGGLSAQGRVPSSLVGPISLQVDVQGADTPLVSATRTFATKRRTMEFTAPSEHEFVANDQESLQLTWRLLEEWTPGTFALVYSFIATPAPNSSVRVRDLDGGTTVKHVYTGDLKDISNTDVPDATALASEVRGFEVSPKRLLAPAGEAPEGRLMFILITLAEGATARTLAHRTVLVGPPRTNAALLAEMYVGSRAEWMSTLSAPFLRTGNK